MIYTRILSLSLNLLFFLLIATSCTSQEITVNLVRKSSKEVDFGKVQVQVTATNTSISIVAPSTRSQVQAFTFNPSLSEAVDGVREKFSIKIPGSEKNEPGPGATNNEIDVLATVFSDRTDVVLGFAQSTNSAMTVRNMWNSQRFKEPESLEEAAINYANAFSVASERLRNKVNDRDQWHQYDVIACYMALRAFRKVIDKSANTHFAMPSGLKEIADWYKDLLEEVPIHNLEPVKNERHIIADSTYETVQFYEKEWKRIKTLSKHDQQLIQQSQFNKALLAESQCDVILRGIQLTRFELLSTLLEYAGRCKRGNINDVQVIGLTKAALEYADEFLSATSLSNGELEKLQMSIAALNASLEGREN